MDQGFLGQHLLQELSAKPNYVVTEMNSEEELKKMVISQKTNGAFVIPAGFTDSIIDQEPVKVSMYQLNVTEATFTLKLQLDQEMNMMTRLVDTVKTSGLSGDEMESAMENLVEQKQLHLVRAKVTDLDLYVNPTLSTVIGFTLMFMMGLINSSVASVVEDRRQNTMSRMYTAPVRSFEIALGNFMGSLFLGMLQILFVLLVTRYALGFDYKVSFGSQFLILCFFLLASMGIASAVAGLVRNANHLGAINSLIVTPTCMIGGCFWPIQIMPDFMQKLANFVPQKWAIEAIVKMAGGESILRLGVPIAILVLFAVILLGVGSATLKPSEADIG